MSYYSFQSSSNISCTSCCAYSWNWQEYFSNIGCGSKKKILVDEYRRVKRGFGWLLWMHTSNNIKFTIYLLLQPIEQWERETEQETTSHDHKVITIQWLRMCFVFVWSLCVLIANKTCLFVASRKKWAKVRTYMA